jgi:hypothetical protein
MLYDSNPKKNTSSGGSRDDFFNKQKLAKEAASDLSKIKEAQREQEKRKIQLQIDNKKRELDRLEMDLQARNLKQTEAKRRVDDVKKRSLHVTVANQASSRAESAI